MSNKGPEFLLINHSRLDKEILDNDLIQKYIVDIGNIPMTGHHGWEKMNLISSCHISFMIVKNNMKIWDAEFQGNFFLGLLFENERHLYQS